MAEVIGIIRTEYWGEGNWAGKKVQKFHRDSLESVVEYLTVHVQGETPQAWANNDEEAVFYTGLEDIQVLSSQGPC